MGVKILCNFTIKKEKIEEYNLCPETKDRKEIIDIYTNVKVI